MHFVNNASTDGTAAYLSRLTAMGKYHIINCTKNISGAGGFAKGLSQTITYDVDCILFIDDDAMLSPDYYEETSSGAKLLSEISCLLDEKTGSDVLDWQEGDVLERRYLWYEYLQENYMVEYTQVQNADDTEAMLPTGRIFEK